MKLRMILHWLSRHWKNIRMALLRKDWQIYQIIATKKTLDRMYDNGLVDEWQDINNFKGE